MPFGTGTLYVREDDEERDYDEGLLVEEDGRLQNLTETQEAQVAQYLCHQGGHARWSGLPPEKVPNRTISCLHAGPDQQVLGYSNKQRCDVTLCFYPGDEGGPTTLVYVNYHGEYYHYSGHLPDCPLSHGGRIRRQLDRSPEDLDILMRLGRADLLVPSCRSTWGCADRENPLAPPGSCPEYDFCQDQATTFRDSFRSAYVEAMTAVSPQTCKLVYGVCYACDFFHGKVTDFHRGREVPVNGGSRVDRWLLPDPLGDHLLGNIGTAFKLNPGTTPTYFVHDDWPLVSSHQRGVRRRRGERRISQRDLVADILTGRVDGFVTLEGGKERVPFDESRGLHPSDLFGFCVQRHRVSRGQVSGYTLGQMRQAGKDLLGDDDGNPDDNVEGNLSNLEVSVQKQPARTMSSGEFHPDNVETLSTSYFRWLLRNRGLSGFKITHFLRYRFSDEVTAPFIRPLLQRRHEYKAGGNKVAAEVLKLVLNGCYGYSALESKNYSDSFLLTDNVLRRKKGALNGKTVQNICLMGVVVRKRLTRPPKKKRARVDDDDDDDADNHGKDETENVCAERKKIGEKKKKGRNKKKTSSLHFLDDEAECSSSDKENDDDDDDDDASRDLDSFIVSDTDAVEDEEEEEEELSFYRRCMNLERAVNCRSNSDPVDKKTCNDSEKTLLEGWSKIQKKEARLERGASSTTGFGRRLNDNSEVDYEHLDAKNHIFRYLFRVDSSGKDKPVHNALCKAVAVLSNSKRLFFDRVLTLLECLDPAQSEVLYTDTDSVLLSLARPKLRDCVRPEMLTRWDQSDILVDETSPLSQHGKLKVEGTYRGARFRALKMYRLYPEGRSMDADCDSVDEVAPAETRCKGVSRRVASQLEDSVFDPRTFNDKRVVTRTALQPTAGCEMEIIRQSRSMTGPYNFKRYVTSDGLHTLPFSLAPEKEDPTSR